MEENLADELVEEFLVRLPVDHPRSLVRAAAVSRRWCRIICGPGFLRRFVEHHGEPSLLGFLANIQGQFSRLRVRFVPTPASFLPLSDHDGRRTLDSRHGRVLFGPSDWTADLEVWDPVTGEAWDLPPLPLEQELEVSFSWNAAVLCAAHGACDHLDCHGGQFLVVVVDTDGERLRAHVYNSGTESWSKPTFGPPSPLMGIDPIPPALVESSIFFVIDSRSTVLRFEITNGNLTKIPLPRELDGCPCALTTVGPGILGLARIHNSKITLWKMEAGGLKVAGSVWKEIRVRKVPVHPSRIGEQYLGATHGFQVLFVGSLNARSTFILTGSDQVTEQDIDDYRTESVVPYVCFLSPDLFSPSLNRISAEPAENNVLQDAGGEC